MAGSRFNHYSASRARLQLIFSIEPDISLMEGMRVQCGPSQGKNRFHHQDTKSPGKKPFVFLPSFVSWCLGGKRFSMKSSRSGTALRHRISIFLRCTKPGPAGTGCWP